MARLIIPGHQTGGPGEDAFRKLSLSFSRAIGGLLFAPNSANPFWPLDRNRDAILRAIWNTEVREARIAGMNAYQPVCEGKMRGNYTLRASLSYMDPEQAARIASILDPT